MSGPDIEPLGDTALLLRWGERIDFDLNRRVHAFADAVSAEPPAWLVDVVPAYASLALFVDLHAFERDAVPLAVAEDWVRRRLLATTETTPAVHSRLVEIPVEYGGERGPDLAEVAVALGLSAEEVVARHHAAEYRVAMLGFSPGFPYLLGLDPRLALPRRATPRTRVPAGSVAIGGAQTGIYPRESPGGWHVIGWTPRTLFDPARESPALLAPGDRVRFVAEGRR